MYPHRIRLRGPWECRPLDPPGAAFRVAMPCRWADVGRPGLRKVHCRRAFGYPGRIDPHERVWLALAGVAERATVALNGLPLGEVSGPAEFHVTDRLGPRNEVAVEVEGPPGGGLWGEVALEVRCTAYLRSVRAWAEADGATATVHAAGEVVGQADGPLDLYLILGRTPLAEMFAGASPEGRPFHLAAARVDAGRLDETVRLELVRGATVWYTTEAGPAKAPAGPQQ
jgi:hypothetical protein